MQKSPEQERHAAQLAFVASGQDLEVGNPADLPLAIETLATLSATHPSVVESLSGGLTAEVWHLRAAGRDWTLKRARERCLVQNVDGQTSFLNEIQRRADLEALKAQAGGKARFAGVVDTCWGSYRQGLLLSPWIEGAPVQDWTESRLRQIFALLEELLLAGLFEWDLCPGNILDDGAIRLFDFGYMYRFNPLRDFNSNGCDAPLFHAAERFETRNYFAWLLELERHAQDQALAAFVLEKRIALECYERLISRLRQAQAAPAVLEWLNGFVTRWRQALASDPAALYLAEGWRSHRLDLDDDLRGQTCTPRTIKRADWLLATVRENFTALKELKAFFWHDDGLDRNALIAQLEKDRSLALGWQVEGKTPNSTAA